MSYVKMNRDTSSGSALKDAFNKAVLMDIWKGMGVTLRHMFEKRITYQYPEQLRPVAERWRGMHQFMTDDAGRELCVACGMCSGVCPADAIVVQPGEREDGTRYPRVYDIHVARCIYCGYCEEACPYGAIVLTTNYKTVESTKDKLVYHKDDLIHPKWEKEGKE